MSIEEKRRAAFEAWWAESGMSKFKDTAEASWNAALDSVVIELPEKESQISSWPEMAAAEMARNDAIESCRDAIQSAGLKVKP